MASTGEDEKMCYICLSSGGDLQCRCSCRKLSAHPTCVARWQLQRAGTEEERTCRFCASALPSWETVLTPEEVPRAQPTLAIICQGKLVRLRLDGHNPEVFKATIRKAFNLPPSVELDVTFEAKVPGSGDRIRLKGLESYPAAMHCAAVSAGQRAARKGLLCTQPLPASDTIISPSTSLAGRSNSDLGATVPRPAGMARARQSSESGAGPIGSSSSTNGGTISAGPSRSSSLTLPSASVGLSSDPETPTRSSAGRIVSPFANLAQQAAAPTGHHTTVDVLATAASVTSTTAGSMLLPAASGLHGDALCSRRSMEDRSSLTASMRHAAAAAAQLGWLPPAAASASSSSGCLSAQQQRAAVGGAASASSSSSGRVCPLSLDESTMHGSSSSDESLASSAGLSPVSSESAYADASRHSGAHVGASESDRHGVVTNVSASQLSSPSGTSRRRPRAPYSLAPSGAEHAGRWSFASCFGL